MINTKSFAFFDTKAVTSRLDPAMRKYLGWSGGLTRKVARRSLRPAAQKKIIDMTEEETAAYAKRVEWAKKNGLPKPRRPEVSAAPGNPPKLHDKRSPLKYLLYFGLELKNDNAVIGPQAHGARIAEKLEKTHPFMGPALDIVKPQLPNYWKNLITK